MLLLNVNFSRAVGPLLDRMKKLSARRAHLREDIQCVKSTEQRNTAVMP